MDIGASYIFNAITRPFVKGMDAARKALGGFTKSNDTAGDAARAAAKKLEEEKKALDNEKIDKARGRLDSLKTTLMGLNLVSLSDIEGRVSGFVNSLGNSGGSGFTSGLARMGMDFDKSFAGMAAKAGIYGKALRSEEKKIFSAAYGLNADANSLGENYLGLKKAGVAIDDLGLSLQDLVRVTEVTGLSGEQLGAIFTDLTRGYGFTTESARKFMDTFTQQVTALGMGAEAFGSIDDIFKNMDEKFVLTLKSEGPAEAEKALSSITRLAKGMTDALGGTLQDNITGATQLFSKLQDEANVLPTMMAGMDASFGELATQLGVTLPGGFNEAMAAIKAGSEDPLEFAKNIAKMGAEIKAVGGPQASQLMLSMSKTLTDELGPSFAYLFQSGMKGADALAAVQKPIEGGIKSLKELGKEGYRTGLSTDDSLQRIKDGFEATWKGIASTTRDGQTKQTNDANLWVKTQRESYSELGKSLKQAASGKGVPILTEQMKNLGISSENIEVANGYLGKFTHSLSLYQAGGLSAAFQPFVGEKGVFGKIAKFATESTPMLSFLDSFGLSLDDIIAPITGITGGITALIFAVPSVIEVFSQLEAAFTFFEPAMLALEAFGGSFITLLGGPEIAIAIGALGAIAVALGGIAIASGLSDKALAGDFGPTIQGIAEKAQGFAMEAAAAITTGLFDFKDWAKAFNADEITKSITDTLNGALDGVEKWLNTPTNSLFLDWITRIVIPALYDIGTILVPKLYDILGNLPIGDIFQRVGSLLGKGFNMALDTIIEFGINTLSNPGFWSGIFSFLLWGLTTAFKNMAKGMIMPLQFLFGFLSETIPATAGRFLDGLSWVFEQIKPMLVSYFEQIKPTLVSYFENLTIGDALKTFFNWSPMGMVYNLLKSITDYIGAYLSSPENLMKVAEAFNFLFSGISLEDIGTVLNGVLTFFSGIFSSDGKLSEKFNEFRAWAAEAFSSLFSGISLEDIGTVLNGVLTFFSSIFSSDGKLGEKFNEFREMVAEAFNYVKETFISSVASSIPLFGTLFTFLKVGFNLLGTNASEVFMKVKTSILTAFMEVMNYLDNTFTWLEETFTWIGATILGVLVGVSLAVMNNMTALSTTIHSVFDEIILFFLNAWDKVSLAFKDSGVLGAVKAIGEAIGIGDKEAPTLATPEQVIEAKKTEALTEVQLLAKGDARSIIQVLLNEGRRNREALGEIRDKIQVIPSPMTRPGSPKPTGDGTSGTLGNR